MIRILANIAFAALILHGALSATENTRESIAMRGHTIEQQTR